jgi:hypothetical protein
LLNCIGKIVKKVVVEIIAKLYERLELLYNGQFGSRKLRRTINTVTKLITTVKQAWKRKKIAGTLFLDIKGAFPNVIRQQLVKKLIKLKIPGDIIR